MYESNRNLTTADEDQRLGAVAPERLTVPSTAPIQPSVMNWPAALDAGESERCNSNINVSRHLRQQTSAKIPPRSRILSAAAGLFFRLGISGVSIEAIVREAATTKPTLYRHFASKDELVAEYLRESAKRLDACWAKIDNPRSAGARVQLNGWLAEMADGLIDGWSCRFTDAVAELKEKSHPARRIVKAFNALQRRRLTRLCRAAGLRHPSMLADALLLLLAGACVMAPSAGRVGLSSRFLHLGEAMIAAHTKTRVGVHQGHHP